MDAADKFDKLGEKLCDDAACVPCTKEEYMEGLEVIIERLQLDLVAAKET